MMGDYLVAVDADMSERSKVRKARAECGSRIDADAMYANNVISCTGQELIDDIRSDCNHCTNGLSDDDDLCMHIWGDLEFHLENKEDDN